MLHNSVRYVNTTVCLQSSSGGGSKIETMPEFNTPLQSVSNQEPPGSNDFYFNGRATYTKSFQVPTVLVIGQSAKDYKNVPVHIDRYLDQQDREIFIEHSKQVKKENGTEYWSASTNQADLKELVKKVAD